uniref:Uncharacterized protein n=1 Tax=Cacopsylla melanoneura TaxID=428564 RepID=A0A8D8QZU8_9HEMI
MKPFDQRKQPPRSKKISNNANIRNISLSLNINNQTTENMVQTTKETPKRVTRQKTKPTVTSLLIQSKTKPINNQEPNTKPHSKQKPNTKAISKQKTNTKMDSSRKANRYKS